MSGLVKVLQVGNMTYECALQLQKILANKHFVPHKNGNMPLEDTLVLVEHSPVYTVGIRDRSYSVKDEEKLKSLGAAFHRTNRGGLITFHGPGQLVVYPVLNLKHFKPSMRWYVSQLENTIIELCKHLNIKAETSPHTGVWVQDKKICAIGIHGSRFVTTHGLALNCDVDLEWFAHIVPCGIEGKGVTSLSEVLESTVTVEDTIPLFLRCFSKMFSCSLCIYPKEDAGSILKQLQSRSLYD